MIAKTPSATRHSTASARFSRKAMTIWLLAYALALAAIVGLVLHLR